MDGDSAEPAERMDVSVEVAVCHTLLGDLDAALAALRLTRGSSGDPDNGVVEFVAQAGEGGPEAGACMLVERWVRTVLTEEVPEFYKGRTFTLEYWGSLPEVRHAMLIKRRGLPGVPFPVVLCSIIKAGRAAA